MPAVLDADGVAPLIGAEVSAVLEDVAERSGDAGNGDLRNNRVAFAHFGVEHEEREARIIDNLVENVHMAKVGVSEEAIERA
jgi:hypothetical protein